MIVEVKDDTIMNIVYGDDPDDETVERAEFQSCADLMDWLPKIEEAIATGRRQEEEEKVEVEEEDDELQFEDARRILNEFGQSKDQTTMVTMSEKLTRDLMEAKTMRTQASKKDRQKWKRKAARAKKMKDYQMLAMVLDHKEEEDHGPADDGKITREQQRDDWNTGTILARLLKVYNTAFSQTIYGKYRLHQFDL